MIQLSKFVHSSTGRYMMSILLGFGLASLFRTVCKDKGCLIFHAPPLDDFKDKIYRDGDKCVKYTPIATKCNKNTKTVLFE